MLRKSFVDYPIDGSTDGIEAEGCRIEGVEGRNDDCSCIIGGAGLGKIGHVAEVEHIEGMNLEAAIHIQIRDGEKVAAGGDFQSGLFADFAARGLLARLVHIDEAAREVERPLRRVFLAAHEEQLAGSVADEAGDGRRRIEVIDETTRAAFFRLEVVGNKIGGAAAGAEMELF